MEELEEEKQQADNQFLVRRQRQQGFSGWDPFEETQHMQMYMDQMFQDSFDYTGSNRGIFSSDMSFGYNVDFEEKDNEYEKYC